ncbi:hypothetical protein AW119_10140 [Escherichia coli]|nr:hypothetical protein AW095_04735 [Escherichia coli]OTE51621.1 hypothetical protein AW119_10140 [Escherichia coli]TJQ47291.1 hypothetical protein C9Z62_12850 [Escherichia coli]
MLRFLTEWLSKRCVNIIDMYQICFVTRQCLVNINKKPGAGPGSYSFALLGNILICLFSTHKYGFTAFFLSGHYQAIIAFVRDPYLRQTRKAARST